MPGHAAYPTQNDLLALLGSAKIPASITGSMDLTTKINTARSDFETDTGRNFLPVIQTRTFRPPTYPRRLLDLRADLAANPTSLTVSGVLLTLGVDYVMGPENADADAEPWLWVEFANPIVVMNITRIVSITGSWGYGLTLPDDVWQAMLSGAAWLCYPEMAAATSKGLLMKREGDVAKEFARGAGTGPYATEAAAWRSQYEAAKQQYTRVAVGLW